jgi:cytochrome c biogenesis protein CcdA
MVSESEFAAVVQAYRKARWTIVGHAVFVVVCCVGVVMLRRAFRLPSALLGVVFIVALIVFGGDIMKFFRCRDRLRRLTEDQSHH